MHDKKRASPAHPHEAAFIEAFVRPQRRERWRLLLDPGHRSAILNRLAHQAENDLDPACIIRVAGAWSGPDQIAALIRAITSANTCHAISEGANDGRSLALVAALHATVGAGLGTILSVLAGRVAFFEPEDGSERCLLVADPAARAVIGRTFSQRPDRPAA